jgi:ankyrin repeat protein
MSCKVYTQQRLVLGLHCKLQLLGARRLHAAEVLLCVCSAMVVQVLLDAGGDAFAVDESGVNALLLAAGCGCALCVQLLLAEGVDADYHNSDLGAGEHALLAAAEGGWLQCVQLLLAAGARVNRTDKEGRTALWVASK